MFKYLLQSVEGIQWFGITALLIFFGTFLFAVLRVFFNKKDNWEAEARLPLDD